MARMNLRFDFGIHFYRSGAVFLGLNPDPVFYQGLDLKPVNVSPDPKLW